MRVARALDQQQVGESVEVETRLAQHYEAAGELNAAFQHWLRGSLYAWRIHDPAAAVTALETAEKILERLEGQASDIAIYQLYRQWGHLCADLNDTHTMERIFQKLLRYGHHRQNAMLVGSGYIGLAQAAAQHEQPEQGMQFLEKAQPFIEQSGKLFDRIEARNFRALFLLQTGQYLDAQNVYQQALQMGEHASDAQSVAARAQTQYGQSLLLCLSGWPLLALDAAEKSARDAEEAFSRSGEVRAANARSAANLLLGRLSESRQIASAGLEQAVEMKFPLLTGELYGSLAQACLAAGDLDGCWENLWQARAAAQQHPYSTLDIEMQSVLADLYRAAGAPHKALQVITTGTGEARNYALLNNRIVMAAALYDLGETAQAASLAENCQEIALRGQLFLLALKARLVLAQVFIQAGQYDGAANLLSIADEARRRRLPELALRARLLECTLAMKQGQLARAAQLARSAAAEAHATGYFLLEIEAYRLWAAVEADDTQSTQRNAAETLEQRLESLRQRTITPELRDCLTNLQKSVDKNP